MPKPSAPPDIIAGSSPSRDIDWFSTTMPTVISNMKTPNASANSTTPAATAATLRTTAHPLLRPAGRPEPRPARQPGRVRRRGAAHGYPQYGDSANATYR
ncbi:hypothetical protein MTP06_19630 [Streptomyces sp. PLM4]|nr:hypothetical protein MTP06_19630 [Streptomyces sp. PLM4]